VHNAYYKETFFSKLDLQISQIGLPPLFAHNKFVSWHTKTICTKTNTYIRLKIPESTNPESTNPESTNPESANPESTNPEFVHKKLNLF
jgi:hypothetical protein